MPPQPHLAIVATVQQAISSLLTTYEPEFLRLGYSMFVAFATIQIVWHGVRVMLSGESLGEHMFGFAKLLMFIAFGYAIVACYESPIPGIGVSFSNLITDQTHDLANILTRDRWNLSSTISTNCGSTSCSPTRGPSWPI